jgi:hypothetical protein
VSSGRSTDLRGRMTAAATRTQPDNPSPTAGPSPSVAPAEGHQPAPPPRPARERVSPVKTAAYKGTFEMSRPDAKRLRLTAMEHDTSVTRLVEAAAITALEDPAVMAAVLRVHDRLLEERR